MLNAIWVGILLLAVVVGIIEGRLEQVVLSVTSSAKIAAEFSLGLIGIMSLWLGFMKIAEESGFMQVLARLLSPVMRWLFPEVPPQHPAMGAMSLNFAANMLGLANAATPFGLQAMRELQRLNTHVHTASNSMCVFLAINTSSIQLIPTTAIAYLAINGATHPSSIIVSSLLATLCSTLVAVIAVKLLAKLPMYQIKIADNL